jgi:hypothetical protein
VRNTADVSGSKLKMSCKVCWMRVAEDRARWREIGEAYVSYAYVYVCRLMMMMMTGIKPIATIINSYHDLFYNVSSYKL